VLHPTDWFNDLMSVLGAISAAGMMSGARAAANTEGLFAKAAGAYREGITDEIAGRLGSRFKEDHDELAKLVGKSGSCRAA